jgi:hypothetical protein
MDGNRSRGILSITLSSVAALIFSGVVAAQSTPEDSALTQTITQLDSKVFDAYNRCDLVAFGRYFAPDVEFYHDTGGASFDRKTVIDNTRKYICHKVRRELLSETFRVFPLKGYGAIEEGEHRFCQIQTGDCEGIAKFLMIWRNKNGRWKLTRVVSYGHRTLGEGARLKLP